MIYLDNAATTRTDPRVRRAMRDAERTFGNPSSSHVIGRKAAAVLMRARETVASALGAESDEIVFVGSGTEANNTVLKGLFFRYGHEKNHIVTTQVEHGSVEDACRWLEGRGATVTRLPVDGEGFVDPRAVANAITDRTLLVSVIHANNEIGTIQPIREIAEVCKVKGTLFHTDACQSFLKVPLSVREVSADFVTVNAHKIHGPKGVAAVFVRRGASFDPLLHGGGQESGRRSSTENVPGIVGFARATQVASFVDAERMTRLRDRFLDQVLGIDGIRLNGPAGERRLCNNINLSFRMIEGEAVRDLLAARGICVSTGSACSSGSSAMSPVIRAIGCPMEYAHGNVRISISKDTGWRELSRATREIKRIIKINSMRRVA